MNNTAEREMTIKEQSEMTTEFLRITQEKLMELPTVKGCTIFCANSQEDSTFMACRNVTSRDLVNFTCHVVDRLDPISLLVLMEKIGTKISEL